MKRLSQVLLGVLLVVGGVFVGGLQASADEVIPGGGGSSSDGTRVTGGGTDGTRVTGREQ